MSGILNKIKENIAKRKANKLALANNDVGWKMAAANNAIEELMLKYSLGPVHIDQEVPYGAYSSYVEEVDPNDYMSVADARRAAASRKLAAEQAQQSATAAQPKNKKEIDKLSYLQTLRAGYTKAAADAGLNDTESIKRMQLLLKGQGYYERVKANQNQSKVDGLWGNKSQEAYALYLEDLKNNKTGEQKPKPTSEAAPKLESTTAIINSGNASPITLATQLFAHNPYGTDYMSMIRENYSPSNPLNNNTNWVDALFTHALENPDMSLHDGGNQLYLRYDPAGLGDYIIKRDGTVYTTPWGFKGGDNLDDYANRSDFTQVKNWNMNRRVQPAGLAGLLLLLRSYINKK